MWVESEPSRPRIVEATGTTARPAYDPFARLFDDGVEEPPKPVSGASILAAELGDVLWVIGKLLHQGASVLAGKPKVGKSWLALQIGIGVASDLSVLGYRVEKPGPVLYLALEDNPRRLQRRLKALTPSGVGLENIDFVCDMPHKMDSGGDDDRGTAHLKQMLRAKPYVALIIDTLPAAFAAITQRDVVRAQYAQSKLLREIAEEFQVAVLVIQHMRKQSSDQAVDKVSGTSGVTAGLDSVLTLDRDKNGLVTLEITSRETDGEVLPVKLDLAAGGWVRLQSGPLKLTPEREDIRELLSERGPLAPKDIAKALNKGEAATRQLLRSMSGDGIIEKTKDKYHLKPCWERDAPLGQPAED